MPKIKNGYYIKARCIQESAIQHAPPHFREIWDWLLKEANHSDKKYGHFVVKRGQCFRSYKDIRDGLSWKVGYRTERYSENQTKKAMRFLRENQMIDTQKELGGVLITICNYDRFQNPKNYERTSEGTNERTNGEPMGNQGGTDNNKNEKNEKNEKRKPSAKKKVIASSPPDVSDFKPTDATIKVCKDLRIGQVKFKQLAECCFDHFRSKGESRVDWQATVRNWIKRDLDYKGGATLESQEKIIKKNVVRV